MEIYKETPEIISWIDSEQSKLTMEITLLEVEKENMQLMMNENGCYLFAPSEVSEYVAVLSFPSPVKPSEARAQYRDGYLVVEVPFKEPLADYIRIAVE